MIGCLIDRNKSLTMARPMMPMPTKPSCVFPGSAGGRLAGVVDAATISAPRPAAAAAACRCRDDRRQTCSRGEKEDGDRAIAAGAPGARRSCVTCMLIFKVRNHFVVCVK